MKIGILGTGMVGRAHAARLAELGHNVTLGTRDVDATRKVIEADQMGNPPFAEWEAAHESVTLKTFAEAAQESEMVLNALKGEVSLETLRSIADELQGKVLVDIANPLDFSQGMPPSLSIVNTNSLGEETQKALPGTKVVKAFNTLNAYLQVDPKRLADGKHTLFIAGNDADAKKAVRDLATEYGWTDVLDLGDITNARGTEMLLPIWLRLWGALQTAEFNFHIVR